MEVDDINMNENNTNKKTGKLGGISIEKKNNYKNPLTLWYNREGMWI